MRVRILRRTLRGLADAGLLDPILAKGVVKGFLVGVDFVSVIVVYGRIRSQKQQKISHLELALLDCNLERCLAIVILFVVIYAQLAQMIDNLV